ncbi:hypothetical protein [Nocardioides sp.]|uniref:hypothetical protein n=1 Tax=Nocardioides sp. TaxID=35761 RepID=UPI003513E438
MTTDTDTAPAHLIPASRLWLRLWFLLAPSAATGLWGWCLIRSYDDAVSISSQRNPDLDISLGGMGNLLLGAAAVLVGAVALTVLVVDLVSLARARDPRVVAPVSGIGAVLVGVLLTGASVLAAPLAVKPYDLLVDGVMTSPQFVLGMLTGPVLILSAVATRRARAAIRLS